MTQEWLYEMDDVGQSPLTRASKSGRSEVTTFMIMQEQQDHPRNYRSLPTLHRAACWGFDDVVLDLLEDGVDIQEKDDQGETALHKAVRMGHTTVVRTLLEKKADVNAADSLGMTPLHWAALTGNTEITEVLLMYFANVEAGDYFAGGITPLGVAKLLGYTEIEEMMRNRFRYL